MENKKSKMTPLTQFKIEQLKKPVMRQHTLFQFDKLL